MFSEGVVCRMSRRAEKSLCSVVRYGRLKVGESIPAYGCIRPSAVRELLRHGMVSTILRSDGEYDCVPTEKGRLRVSVR